MIRRLRSTLSSKRDIKMRTLLLLKKKCKEKIVTGYKLGQFSVGYRIWKLKKQQKTTGARGRPKTPIHHEVGIPKK